MLYGLPLPPPQVYRLARVGKTLGTNSISVLIDDHEQLRSLHKFRYVAGFGAEIFVKIDTGYHRAGLPIETSETANFLKSIFTDEEYGKAYKLKGFYSHAGHSYGVSSSATAMEFLMQEIDGLGRAATLARSITKGLGLEEVTYVLSVGATPATTSIEYLLQEEPDITGHTSTLPVGKQEQIMIDVKDLIKKANKTNSIELHAGMYPFLDMQQLATKASPSSQSIKGMVEKGFPDMALTVLTEVASLCSHREPPEALIAAGSLALGREPCKSYDGWGVVSNWNDRSDPGESSKTTEPQGWIVARVSREHGILQKASSSLETAELHVGQKVRIWPNHACVAGAGFGFYLVVDSSLPANTGNEIVDVWIRCRGW